MNADDTEDEHAGKWVALMVATVLGGALAFRLFGRRPSPSDTARPGNLSDKRTKVLEVVASVVPSRYGDERWRRLAPAYDPQHLPAQGYTTCGELPRFVGSQFGIATRGGLASIRDLAKAHGAWIDGAPGRRPLPGDFLVLGLSNGEILHVCVAISTDGTAWTTADAGQGPPTAQEARYLKRTYDPAAETLTSPSTKHPIMLIVGWLDVDKFTAGDTAKA